MTTKIETVVNYALYAKSNPNPAFLETYGLTEKDFFEQTDKNSLSAHNALLEVSDNPHTDWYIGHHAKNVQKNLEDRGFKPSKVDPEIENKARQRFRDHYSNGYDIKKLYGNCDDSLNWEWKKPRKKRTTKKS